jgi:hypothetical protein
VRRDSRIVLMLSVWISSAQAETPSFTRDILPTLRSRCAICHSTGDEAGHLGLAQANAYKNLTTGISYDSGVRLIEPNEPNKSYLVMKLEGTHLDHGGQGARMPFGDAPLDAIVIATIRQWIAVGAPDN